MATGKSYHTKRILSVSLKILLILVCVFSYMFFRHQRDSEADRLRIREQENAELAQIRNDQSDRIRTLNEEIGSIKEDSRYQELELWKRRLTQLEQLAH